MLPISHLPQPKTSVIPDRLFRILESCQGNNGDHRFPPTEIFNEGWMLRLTLDAFQSLKIQNHPLAFIDEEAKWFSEARLPSPFLRRPKKDLLTNYLLINGKDAVGEGYTCADGVIGHFAMRTDTKAGIKLVERPRQFIVVEAKLNSRLSPGIKRALEYNQAARNIACMAEMMRIRGVSVRDFDSVGFLVVAPQEKLQLGGTRDIETYLHKSTILRAIKDRMTLYEKVLRNDKKLEAWKKTFDELLNHMTVQPLPLIWRPLSWESVVDLIGKTHPETGTILNDFYQACRFHAGLKRQC
jgi:hypothetical protein